jgi:hypothetical protein
MSIKRLIINSGDIGDVDGFFALAEYAKTGADVLFIMNYPAYFNADQSVSEHINDFGLGYSYNVMDILNMTRLKYSWNEKYKGYIDLLGRFGISDLFADDVAVRFKKAYTWLALVMCQAVWAQCKPLYKGKAKGALHFCIGGVNDIDPFYLGEANNEVYLFSDLIKTQSPSSYVVNGASTEFDFEEGMLIGLSGNSALTIETLVEKFQEIYLDFNGSMAFLNPRWCAVIDKICKDRQAAGAFIQGGIYTNTTPKTAPARKNVINRLSCSTMNQLYAPKKSGLFFQLMAANNVRMYVVANNDVNEMSDYQRFFSANDIHSDIIQSYADIFYASREEVRIKPYDFYVALLVSSLMQDAKVIDTKAIYYKLFYNSDYAATLITGQHHTSLDAVVELIQHQDLVLKPKQPGESDSKRMEKRTYQREFEILLVLRFLEFNVCTFTFKVDEKMRLTIR